MALFFPVPEWNKQSYKEGMRQFGWSRNGGKRFHAGCDIYAPLKSPVIAIADGVVVENAFFYLGTNQISVRHDGIGVVRYGEIVDIPKKFAIGSPVVAGELVGKIGHLTGIKVHPMLHFELFDGSETGSLSLTGKQAESKYKNVKQQSYRRRADLMNAADLLDRLYLQGEK
jgi:murein DD-endopeptidase MepM/ murein hydrolase activator NlpD